MYFSNFSKMLALSGFLIAGAGIQGCSGGSPTSGGEESFDGTTFVADDSTTGKIEVELNSTEIPVGTTSGFHAFVSDASGRPVPSIRVLCDSEAELAIVEPTRGSEITDSTGGISGLIGCNQPGSYQFGCRLPTGTNRRKFVDVRCTGEIPEGFAGFPGAAGGGLGGGRVPPSAGAPGGSSDAVRVTSIQAFNVNAPSTATTSIDIQAGICTTGGAGGSAATNEVFGDDSIEIAVINNSSSLIRFTSLRYRIDGTSLTSDEIKLSGEAAAASPGSSVTIRSLFLDARADSSEGGAFTKFPPGSDTSLLDIDTDNDGDVGIKNVTFTLTYTNSFGETGTVTGSTNLSFDNFNYCAGS